MGMSEDFMCLNNAVSLKTVVPTKAGIPVLVAGGISKKLNTGLCRGDSLRASQLETDLKLQHPRASQAINGRNTAPMLDFVHDES